MFVVRRCNVVPGSSGAECLSASSEIVGGRLQSH
jgi:hypothetical protein